MLGFSLVLAACSLLAVGLVVRQAAREIAALHEQIENLKIQSASDIALWQNRASYWAAAEDRWRKLHRELSDRFVAFKAKAYVRDEKGRICRAVNCRD
jgi:hypothetical protein